jgi:DNA polymerase elongation subunit (family B)
MTEAKTEGKEVIPYKTEKELLNGFLDLWIKLDPTIISGWNSEFFDMPYLYHRINKVVRK